jgi:hypothetical protein
MMELEYRFSDEFLIFLSVFAYLSSPQKPRENENPNHAREDNSQESKRNPDKDENDRPNRPAGDPWR